MCLTYWNQHVPWNFERVGSPQRGFVDHLSRHLCQTWLFSFVYITGAIELWIFHFWENNICVPNVFQWELSVTMSAVEWETNYIKLWRIDVLSCFSHFCELYSYPVFIAPETLSNRLPLGPGQRATCLLCYLYILKNFLWNLAKKCARKWISGAFFCKFSKKKLLLEINPLNMNILWPIIGHRIFMSRTLFRAHFWF